MKELPITTSFLPSLAAGETVSIYLKTGPDRRNVTCVNLDGIVNASEGGNVLEIGARDREFLGYPSRSKDELIIVNELFSSFQHDLFSRNVDGGDGLGIYASFRQDITEESRNSTYSRGA